MNQTVILAGTLDTKGEEYLYVKSLFEELGFTVILVDAGINPSSVEADISAKAVAEAGGKDIEKLREDKDRGAAVKAMSQGLALIMPHLFARTGAGGIMGLGGSGGTALITPAMRTLPLGIPKIMISTVAGGNVSPYVGSSDLIMFPSIADIAGLNKLSRVVFRSAVQAMAGMLGCTKALSPDTFPDKPRVAATMYGVTTDCVTTARRIMEENGYEVIVFHASGNGGKVMEQLISEGAFCGVLDLTTTEWCDELFGGIMAAGPARGEAAARTGIPQVVSVGAMDMVTFGPPETVPAKYRERKLYPHNPMITVMRTNEEENRQLGENLARKLNMGRGSTVLLLPLKGVSAVDAEGKVFYGPDEDRVLFETLKKQVDTSGIPIIELDCHINDQAFGEAAAVLLMAMLGSGKE